MQNGDCYEGEFHNSEKEGKGTYYFKNGGLMEGHWVWDYPENCELITPNGIWYWGWWISLSSGNGEILFPNGDKYTGYWHEYKPHWFG